MELDYFTGAQFAFQKKIHGKLWLNLDAKSFQLLILEHQISKHSSSWQ